MIGREHDRQELLDRMSQGHVLMKGPRRVGKTTLMTDMADTPPEGWRMVRVDLGQAKTLEEGIDAVRRGLQQADLSPGEWKDFIKAVKKASVKGLEFDLTAIQAREPRTVWLGLIATALNRAGEGTCLGLLLDEVPWWLDHLQVKRPGEDGHQGKDRAREALALLHGVAIHEGLRDRYRMVLTGSVGLRPIGRDLECNEYLDNLQDYELPPLDQQAGMALFEAELPGKTMDQEAIARAHDLAAGIPEWIVWLAKYVETEDEHVRPRHVDDAASRFLSHIGVDKPFDRERRKHLRLRYGNEDAEVMFKLLDAVAERGGTTPVNGLIAIAIQRSAGRMDGRHARETVDRLVDAYYLSYVDGLEQVCFHTPLFGMAWSRYGSEI